METLLTVRFQRSGKKYRVVLVAGDTHHEIDCRSLEILLDLFDASFRPVLPGEVMKSCLWWLRNASNKD